MLARGAAADTAAPAAGGAGGEGGRGEDIREDGVRGVWEGGCEAVRWVREGRVLQQGVSSGGVEGA